MVIKLGKTYKRENSTAIVDMTGGLELTGKLNNMSDVVNPQIRFPAVKNGNLTNYNNYNYAYIAEWRRYYWIRDWTYSVDGVWICTMEIDALASYRNLIMNSNGYVSRTSNDSYYDNYVIDSAWVAKSDMTVKSASTNSNVITADPEAGCFVIGVISTNAPEYGVTNYYLMDMSNMATLVDNMVSTGPLDTVPTSPTAWRNNSLGSDMLKSIVSPMQYVTQCLWIPLKRSHYSSYSAVPVWLGPWNSGAYGVRLTNITGYYGDVLELSSITIPDDTSTSSYTVCAPYARYFLYNPLLGYFELNPLKYCHCVNWTHGDGQKLYMHMQVNMINGDCELSLSDSGTVGTGNIWSINQLNIGIPISLADISYNYVGMAKSAVDVGGNIANAILKPFARANAITGAINSAIDAVVYWNAPNVSSIKNGGAVNPFAYRVLVVGQFTPVVKRDIANFGLPCNRRLSVVNLFVANTDIYAQITDLHFDESITSAYNYILKEEYEIIVRMCAQGVFLR